MHIAIPNYEHAVPTCVTGPAQIDEVIKKNGMTAIEAKEFEMIDEVLSCYSCGQ